LPFKQSGGIFKITYERELNNKVTVHAIKRNISYGKRKPGSEDSSNLEGHNLNYSTIKGG